MQGLIGSGRKALGWLAFVLAMGTGSAHAAEPAEGSFRIVGYVADAKPLPHVSATKVDVINYAFATLNPQGDIVLQSPNAAESLAALTALRKVNPRLQIVVSVGGWGADHFSEAALTDASRAKFAEEGARLIEKYDLDGIDIDWEYPTLPGDNISHRPEDKRNFSLMLETLRARLDQLGKVHGGRHYLLTIAAADSEFVAGIEIERVSRSLDWINLMTYDFHNSLTPTTGHHAGLHPSALDPANDRAADKAVKQFLDAGVPAKKLNLGVPFYGRAFTDVAPEHNGLQQKYGKFLSAPSWDELKAGFIGKNGYVRYWDAKAQVPYLWNASTRTFVTYEDPQSLKLKMDFVRQHKLGGAMYWEQGLDKREELLGVMDQALHR